MAEAQLSITMDTLQVSLSSCSSKANQSSDLLCPFCHAWPQEKATESLEETKLSFLPALTTGYQQRTPELQD